MFFIDFNVCSNVASLFKYKLYILMSHVNDPITYNHGLFGTSMIRLYPHQTWQPGIILYTDRRPSFMVCLSGSRECSPFEYLPGLVDAYNPTILNISSGGSSDHIWNNYCVIDSDACFLYVISFLWGRNDLSPIYK